jgi:hypothetical protein
MIMNIILYGALGGALSLAGVGVMTQPLAFIAILALVLLIDLHSKLH